MNKKDSLPLLLLVLVHLLLVFFGGIYGLFPLFVAFFSLSFFLQLCSCLFSLLFHPLFLLCFLATCPCLYWPLWQLSDCLPSLCDLSNFLYTFNFSLSWSYQTKQNVEISNCFTPIFHISCCIWKVFFIQSFYQMIILQHIIKLIFWALKPYCENLKQFFWLPIIKKK